MTAPSRPAALRSPDTARSAVIEAVAVALVQSVSGNRSDAAHLANALGTYQRQMRTEGRAVPPSIPTLEKVFAEIWRGPSEATGGRRGSTFVAPAQIDDGADMTASLLDRRATARRMNCSTTTVKRRELAGELPAVRHGRVVRYLIADIEALIENGRI